MYGLGVYGLPAYGQHRVPEVAPFRYIVGGEFLRFVRFTVDATTYAYATNTEVRDSIKHKEGLMMEGLSLSQSWPEEAGIVELSDVTATISDVDGTLKSLVYNNNLQGTECLVEQVIRRTYNDGFTQEKSYCHKLIITSASSRFGEVTFFMREVGLEELDKEWPSDTFQEADWPGLFQDHVGRRIVEPHGQSEKIRGALVDTNGGAGPWIFAFNTYTGAGETQQTVYRDGTIVDPVEYSWTTVTGGGKTLTAVSFAGEFDPVNFQGNYSEIDIDIIGDKVTNPVRVIEHLLVDVLGKTVDSTSFTAAADEMDTQGIEIDYPFGRDGPDTIRSIIGYMLFYSRAGLRRLADGTYSIFQDRKNEDIQFVLDEDNGDMVEVSELSWPEKPIDIGIAYKPNNRKTNEMMHEIRRIVTGGFAGNPSPFEAYHIWKHSVADRIAYYQAKRQELNHVLSIMQKQVNIEIGHFGTVKSQHALPQNFSGIVDDITQDEFGSTLTMRETDNALFSYVAGTLPQDATVGYLEDFSKTDPDKPTNVTIVDGAAPVKEDGTVRAWMKVQATPPTENFLEMKFWLINQNTNAETLIDGTKINATTWEGVFDNVHPNDSYNLFAQAYNRFGRRSLLAGHPSNPITSQQALAPNAPTNLTAEATAGKTIVLEWDAPAEKDVAEVAIYRSTTTGFTPGPGNKIAEERGTTFSDTRGNYGTTYYYKVAFVSTSELESNASNEASSAVPTVDAAGVNKNAPASLGAIGLVVGSSSTYQSADGGNYARVRLDLSSIPADSDRAYIQIRHRKSGTSNYRLDDQIEPGSGTASVWIDDLIPNVQYVFSAQPVSHFGIAGTDQTVTATTPKDSTAPAAPSAVAISQLKVSSYVETVAQGTPPNDFKHTEWEFEVNGSGTWNSKDSREKRVIHDAGGYGSSFRFRARFVDTSGNKSGWTTSASETVSSNVGTTDVVTGGIQTPNIRDTDVTTDKRQDVNTISETTNSANPGQLIIDSVAHSEGRRVTGTGGAFAGAAGGDNDRFGAMRSGGSSTSLQYWWWVPDSSTGGVGSFAASWW